MNALQTLAEKNLNCFGRKKILLQQHQMWLGNVFQSFFGIFLSEPGKCRPNYIYWWNASPKVYCVDKSYRIIQTWFAAKFQN